MIETLLWWKVLKQEMETVVGQIKDYKFYLEAPASNFSNCFLWGWSESEQV